MNQVFQKARDKHMQQATNNEQDQETMAQQQAQSHILLATFEEAVNHFVAHSGEALAVNQDTMRELQGQHPLWPEEQRLAAPQENQ
ncbi:hypothetical protein [Photobacterium sp. Hal280]|uniref:hypothetical protein n=1 Tax=Photobacterium sp. Hal280 TaxID=3035163 RepID=UPI00301D5427